VVPVTHIPRDTRTAGPPAPRFEDLVALTRRLHQLEGRHTTQVEGKTVAAPCPPGEFDCFCGTQEQLGAAITQTRLRIAALTGTSHTAADQGRREQLNRWHDTDDHARGGHARGDADADGAEL
jgi:hypothetical protein